MRIRRNEHYREPLGRQRGIENTENIGIHKEICDMMMMMMMMKMAMVMVTVMVVMMMMMVVAMAITVTLAVMVIYGPL